MWQPITINYKLLNHFINSINLNHNLPIGQLYFTYYQGVIYFLD